MSFTAAVFHPEISLLKDPAYANMCLGVGCQGWAGLCLSRYATLPKGAGKEAASHVMCKMTEKKRVIAAMMSRLTSSFWPTLL